MSDGQPTKPNWVEKTSAVSNVLQNIQLQELHTTLRATGALQAETLQRELNERQVAEREDRLREHVWQMDTALDALLRNGSVLPCAVFVLAKQTQDSLAQFRVNTASFRQVTDKDRLGQFFNRLQQACESAASKMTEDQRKNADTYLRCQSELPGLDDLIKRQELFILYDNATKSADASRMKLNQLQKAAPSSQPPNAVSLLSMGIGFVGFLTWWQYDIPPWPFWAGCFVVAAIAVGAKDDKQPRATDDKQPSLSEEEQEELEDAKSDVDFANDAVALFDPQHTWDDAKRRALTVEREQLLQKYGVKDLQELKTLRQRHISFMVEFEQANGLTTDESPGVTWNQSIAQTVGSGLSPEVQELARHADKKLSAIMLYQKQTGVSLAEAKAAVEAFASLETGKEIV